MADDESFSFGPFRLDKRGLHKGKSDIPLSGKPLAVLRYLVRHAGQVVSLDKFQNEVWEGKAVENGVFYDALRKIRDALGDERHSPQFIRTVYGKGYQ
jgi:DNA-binding winged helix-turn-helix (wHTH) protein